MTRAIEPVDTVDGTPTHKRSHMLDSQPRQYLTRKKMGETNTEASNYHYVGTPGMLIGFMTLQLAPYAVQHYNNDHPV